MGSSTGCRSARLALPLGAVAALLALAAALAPAADAVVVRIGPHQRAGVMPIAGVSPASIPGRVTTASPAMSGASGTSTAAANAGILNYNGGPVLHSSAPYVIFWDPSGSLSPGDEALYEQYFADVAADSGTAGNVFSVNRQFTDATGFADYSQSWTASHAIVDGDPYPSPASQCSTVSSYTETACLYDHQLQAEIQHVVDTQNLPEGVSGQAPIYLLVTPPSVNSCFDDGATCADNAFCAYHSYFTDSSTNQTVLYIDVPLLIAANKPKACQADGKTAVQSPNRDPMIDVALKYTSHEVSETITDPLGNAWYNDASGNEDGDECNYYGSTDPVNGYSPYAFAPTLGGSAQPAGPGVSYGTLFNQVIAQHDYYTQSEWSNGNGRCELQAQQSTLTASFSLPSVATAGSPVTLDPSASTSAAGYTSTTWTFGDGQRSFATTGPAAISHTFATPGTFNVTLTLVDRYGNLATVTHALTVTPSSSGGTTTGNPAQPPPAGAPAPPTQSQTPATAPAAGRIVWVRVIRGRRAERVIVRLSAPGTLWLSRRRARVSRAGTVRFTVRLTAAQRARLRGHHRLTLRYRLTFVPTAGSRSTRRVTIRLR